MFKIVHLLRTALDITTGSLSSDSRHEKPAQRNLLPRLYFFLRQSLSSAARLWFSTLPSSRQFPF